MSWFCSKTKRPVGDDGNPAPVRLGWAPSATSPYVRPNGQVDYALAYKPATYTSLSQKASVTHILMTIHKTQEAYLNGEFETVAVLLGWCSHILSDDSAFSQTWSEPLVSSLTTKNEVRALRNKVDMLSAQLKAGLDFYGLPRNFVPLISLDTYQVFIDELLEGTAKIEKTCDRVFDLQSANDEKLRALDQTLDIGTNAGNKMAAEASLARSQITTIQDAVADLNSKVVEQQFRIQKSAEAFKTAVARKAACTLWDVLTCVASIVSIAEGAYGNVQDIV
jgi:hypothetical protein